MSEGDKSVEGFESRQIMNLYHEEEIFLRDARQSILRKTFYIGILFTIFFVLIGTFVKFPDQVSVSFILKSKSDQRIYISSSPLYITERFVHPGTKVNAGDNLIKITSVAIADLVNELKTTELAEGILNNEQAKLLENQRVILSLNKQRIEEELQQLKQDISFLDKEWLSNYKRMSFQVKDAESKFKIHKKLYAEKVISNFDLIEYERKQIETASELAVARQNYRKSRSLLVSEIAKRSLDLSSSEEQLLKLTFENQLQQKAVHGNYSLAYLKLENLYGNFIIDKGALVLKAEKDGMVSFVSDEENQIEPGAVVLKLSFQKNDDIYAQAQITPSSIGKIHVNDKIIFKINSYPFYEYGVLQGHVHTLSSSPNEQGYFSLMAKIDKIGSRMPAIQAGMNGSAEIVIQEKSIFEFIMTRFKKEYYDIIQ